MDGFEPYMLVEIWKYLDWQHLQVISLVCKHWNKVVRDHRELAEHLRKSFPHSVLIFTQVRFERQYKEVEASGSCHRYISIR